VSIPPCASGLGRGEERTEVMESYGRPATGNVSKVEDGDDPRLLSAVPPSRVGVMSYDASLSSDD
jgi:hypothetical protein